jgi:prepilin signal peptidase PulO-like enzyme (type II secretory pathway)
MRSLLPFLAPVGVIGPVWVFGWPEASFASLVLLGLLCYLAIFDQKNLRLPDHATLPIAVLGMVVTWLYWSPLLASHVGAACVTIGLLWGLSVLWLRMRDVDALGLGDVKLAGAAALWVGPAISFVVMIAAASALLITFASIGLGRTRLNDPIPFGPFLCFGFWVVWCWFAG